MDERNEPQSEQNATERPEPRNAPEQREPEMEQIAALRDMEKSSEQLDEVIEDARGAVQAAHNANSMRGGESVPATGAGEDTDDGAASRPAEEAAEPGPKAFG